MKIIFIIIVIFVIISMIKIEIKFKISYIDSKLNFNVYLYKLNLTRFIRKKDVSKVSKKKRNFKNPSTKRKFNIKISLNLAKQIFRKIKFLKHKPIFIVENFLEFGLEEADITAILYGYVTNFIYLILGIISRYVHVKKSKIDIIPRYNINFLKFSFQGILQIRIAQIIYISFLFITLGRKLNGTTSN